MGQDEATKAQTAKDCSEQFYTDLRRSMSAWLLQRRFDTHDKTSLGAPNRRFAVPQADGHLSTGVGHNEHLLHHRCGGRDHSRRRFFGPASIRKSCKPCSRRPFRTRANNTKVKSPASGRKASAASAALWMLVTPAAWSTAAVVK